MKVIVRCPKNRVTKTEMEREIERLFQENKDLRVQVSHMRDELNLSQQQSEARRQVICERDQHIQELEESLEKNTRLRETSITKMAEIQTKLYEQMREAIDAGAEINIELMEAEATIDEQKKRIEWLEEEVARLTYERDTAVNGNAELIEENTELRDNLDAVINIKNEYAETIDEMRKKIVAAQSPEFTAHLAKLIIANLPSADK